MSHRPSRGDYRPLESVRRYRRPWGVVIPTSRRGLMVITDQGEMIDACQRARCDTALRKLDGYSLFTPNYRGVLRASIAQRWRIMQRGPKVLYARHDNANVRLVPLPVSVHRDPLELAGTVREYLSWLESYDVWPHANGTWSGLGRHLWLSTLDRPVRFHADLERQGWYGARKQIRERGTWRDAAHYDITSAYPSALASGPLPQTLRITDKGAWATADVEGITLASVDVPEHLEPWVPLPYSRTGHRVGMEWRTGEMEAWWPCSELRAAASYGVKVEPIMTYEGGGYREPFEAWLGIVTEGRAMLSTPAAKLLKGHANALWSSFAYHPMHAYRKRYRDDDATEPVIEHSWIPPDVSKHSAFVSALVAARIRVRVLTEALAFDGNDLAVLHVDTDGVIGSGARPPFGHEAIGPGSWRQDRKLRTVEIEAPSVWRYTCEWCGELHPRWHYVVAGAKSRDAAEWRFNNAA